MHSANPKKAFIFSACLHVFILVILIGSFEFSAPMPVVSNNDSKVINAIALKDSPVLAPPTKVIEEKQVVQEPPLLKQEPEASVPNSKPSQPKRSHQEEASKAPPKVEKLALAVQAKKVTEAHPSKKPANKDLSKQLLADLEDEISRQAKVKQKQMKNKFSQELKTQSVKALQQLMKEQKKLAGQRSQHMQGLINKYKALILQAIGQHWVVPSHVDKRLSCQLLIRLAPGGVVLEVSIMKSSGDVLLDRSARAAVLKASPLPVPDDIYSFESFRQFVLKVKPENIQENKGDQGFWIS